MKIYRLELTNTGPLCIRSDRGDDKISTMDYIPGTTFLGALAGSYLKEHNRDEFFSQLFLEDRLMVSPLYPLTSGSSYSYPLPLTALSCKHSGGFRSQDGHGVYDSLFDWGHFSETGKLERFQHFCLESKCRKSPLRNFSGYYCQSGEEYQRFTVEKSLNTHVGINRKTQTAGEGILYNIESIERAYTFAGKLKIADEDTAERLISWLEEAFLFIGAKKTSGMGACEIKVEEEKNRGIEAFQEKLERFNQVYNTRNGGGDGFYFSVDLTSDAVRLDDFLNYITGMAGVEKMFDHTELVFERCESFPVLGWNNSIGLPRQAEKAVKKGSCALFKSRMNKERLISRLFELEQEGVGIRRVEGFGQVEISSPFHHKALEYC